MYPTYQSISARRSFWLPCAFRLPSPSLVMATTPTSSLPSSATNAAEVLAAFPADEVGSWSRELQVVVAPAVAAVDTTSAASTSTPVRRRKGTRIEPSSTSTAAAWMVPPTLDNANRLAIQESERSPAPTTVAGDEVLTFGPPQFPVGDPPTVI